MGWNNTMRRVFSGRPLARVVPAVLALALAVAACKQHEAEAVLPAPPQAPRSVRTVTVGQGAMAQEIVVPATVRARQRATIAARLGASVVELPLREGEAFRRGDVLARLDAGALAAAVRSATAGRAAAQSELSRLRTLRQKDAATSREVEVAEAHAAAAEAQVTAAGEGLAYAVLLAPFDGVVTSRHVDVGDVVPPGQPLLEVEGSAGLEVRATLETRQAQRVSPGDPVKVVVDGVDGVLSAVVRGVSPAGDPTTHRVEMRADLPATPGARSGLFARLVLPSPEAAARLSVPDEALVVRGGLTGVYVVAGGVAHLRWIAAGESASGLTEIRAGLDAGERVVLHPEGLQDGVNVVEGAAS